MRTVVVAAVLLWFAAAARAEEPASVWPPTGPTWETEPGRAFERARQERKAVFVYIATEG